MTIIRGNLWRCVEHIARVSQQTGRTMHLGLEPEPMCVLECSGEVLHLFDRLRERLRALGDRDLGAVGLPLRRGI